MFKFDLLDDEELIASFRQSEAVLFKPVLIVFALIYFPWFFLLKYELPSNFDRLLLFWTLLVLVYAVNRYLLWLLNLCLVTNKRLVNIKHASLFSKQVLESPWDKIVNVSYQAKGFWATLFDFGLVQVQLLGLAEPLLLPNVAHPARVKDSLWQFHSRFGVAAQRVAPQRPVIPFHPEPQAMPSQPRVAAKPLVRPVILNTQKPVRRASTPATGSLPKKPYRQV